MSSQKNSPSSKQLKIKRIFSALLLCILSFPPNFLLALEETLSDQELLRKIQRDSIQYFVDCSDPATGLTRDSTQAGAPSSIAATGFSLAALAIGQKQGWISYQQAYHQILKTLETALNNAQHQNGFFYHFLDPKTGRRVWASEASSIDTALFIAGALLAGEYFKGSPIETLAQQIYERVDWKWMLNQSDLICMGWKPQTGFLPYFWDSYSELIILQALAIGSPTHPIPPSLWNQWNRFEDEYNGTKIVYSHSGSLFTYQYSQAFIDFRELDDRGINYFENSKNATLANKQFCLENSPRFKTYGESSWGLTASLGPGGYKAYGALPGQALHDGTIAPYGSASSVAFTPEESIEAIRFFYENFRDKLYGKYGFKDSFNLDKDWWAQEYLGIDQGIAVLMIENYLGGEVWKRFMQIPAIQQWVNACHLKMKGRENAFPEQTKGSRKIKSRNSPGKTKAEDSSLRPPEQIS